MQFNIEAMGTTKKEEEKKKKKHVELIDVVFSWSLPDVLNPNLFKGKIGKIPDAFSTTTDYFKSFIPPLIEETRADLSSSMKALHKAPAFEICEINPTKEFKPPRDLFYEIVLKGVTTKSGSDGSKNQFESRDLIALADKRPTGVDELRRYDEPFLLALIWHADPDRPNRFTILASKPIIFKDQDVRKKKKKKLGEEESLFGVYLTNMSTNIRIWKALHPGSEGGNLSLISRVLQSETESEESCFPCLLEENDTLAPHHFKSLIRSFKLNSSQEEAISSCLKARKCYHSNTIKLIWGPPGTGKTKTTSVLLMTLLKTRCRTLTCAPTNRAVLEVASRVVKIISESSNLGGGYGLGDIVLFGNGKRMKIDDWDDLVDVFLDYRINELYQCFMPSSGWRANVMSLICLLEDPREQYHQYLENRKSSKKEQDNVSISSSKHKGNGHKLKEKNVKNKGKQAISKGLRKNPRNGKKNREENRDHVKESEEEVSKEEEEEEPRLSFEEYLENRFNYLRKNLEIHISRLCLHLPTTLLPAQVFKKMNEMIDVLLATEVSYIVNMSDEGLRYMHMDAAGAYGPKDFKKRGTTIEDCLNMLRSILETFKLPDFLDKFIIKKLCLGFATLVFSTASSSAKLYTEEPIQLVVVDEAAQLKECESAIPLQLPGVRHAILIGDERQLPAMIQSKIASEAKLGRSLFERLVLLGKEKHLLHMQYRMHPSISMFPNKEFYDMQILDAQSVGERKCNKQFLPGKMYGPYSFINISYGREELGGDYSLKNMVEVAVVSEIVANLFTVSKNTSTKISVGVISPYKAQVFAIQEKIGVTYSNNTKGLFSLSVRSVDGFQGGEEDVIIFSTVRSNRKGTIGFLSDRQRTNVALTRARFCLWILGNEATLANSNSVWRKLIVDAKRRKCFHNAGDCQSLSLTTARMTTEREQLDKLRNKKFWSFNNAKWKVYFSNEFWKSVETIANPEIHKRILGFLEKLSHGWCQTELEGQDAVVSSSKMLKQYRIDGVLSLIWAVDIVKEERYYTQVLKFWNILPLSKVPEAAKCLDVRYQRYTKTKLERCKSICMQGDLVVPLSWPVVSVHDSASSLSGSFAQLNLVGEKSGSQAIKVRSAGSWPWSI